MARVITSEEMLNLPAFYQADRLYIRKDNPEKITEFDAQMKQVRRLQYLGISEDSTHKIYSMVDPLSWEEEFGIEEVEVLDGVLNVNILFRETHMYLLHLASSYIGAVARVTYELPDNRHDAFSSLVNSPLHHWDGEMVINTPGHAGVAFTWNDSWNDIAELLGQGHPAVQSFNCQNTIS